MSSTELVAADAAESFSLTLPQVGCEIVHRFGPGIYIRECRIPKDAFVVSHCHKFKHVNIHLAGIISMRDGEGPIYVSQAPRFYIGQPGRKMGYALTEIVWQNIFATEETDVEKLEAWLFEKSPDFLAHAELVATANRASREVDHWDFHMVLDGLGITPYEARAGSENASDQIPMPDGWGIVIRQSAIEGRGVFVQTLAQPGDVLAPARIGGKRTPAGRFANHSRSPNAVFVEQNGDAYLVALKTIAPFCSETVPGDEVTVDYRQALSLVGRLK